MYATTFTFIPSLSAITTNPELYASRIIPALMCSVSVAELLFITFGLKNLSTLPPDNQYYQFLKEGIKNKQFFRFFLPENLTRYQIGPTISLLTSNINLIAGKE